MTGLRSVETFIDKIGAVENFKCFSEVNDHRDYLLDPRVYINYGIGLSAYAFIDTATRITTAVPTIGYDISYGITHCSPKHLKDAALTIPKGVIHIVEDAGIVTGVAAAGVAALAAGIITGAYAGTLFLLELACSLPTRTISQI